MKGLEIGSCMPNNALLLWIFWKIWPRLKFLWCTNRGRDRQSSLNVHFCNSMGDNYNYRACKPPRDWVEKRSIHRLRITDEGSVPEMRIWSILLIKSDLKWCIHLRRRVFLYPLVHRNNQPTKPPTHILFHPPINWPNHPTTHPFTQPPKGRNQIVRKYTDKVYF